MVGVEGAGHSVQGDRPLELAAPHRRLPLRPGRGTEADGARRGGAPAAERRRAADVWLSRHALTSHAVILVVVPGFMALCVWQLHRALGGNELSWAYVFEWPLFAGYAVYMWWRLVHERPAAPATRPRRTPAGPEPER